MLSKPPAHSTRSIFCEVEIRPCLHGTESISSFHPHRKGQNVRAAAAKGHHLDLEASGSSPPTCTFEFPSFALNVGFLRHTDTRKSAPDHLKHPPRTPSKQVSHDGRPSLRPPTPKTNSNGRKEKKGDMEHTFPLCGPNPKCFTASLEFFGPRTSNVLLPVGALNAS